MKKILTLTKALSIALLFVASTINATTYTVTSTANGTTTDGISLRWAITQANGAAGNSIEFNIPGTAPHTITLTSALPVITKDNITIDGSTQPANGYTGSSPKIIIDGNNIISKGIEASSTKDGIKIYGLYIKGFTDYGIYFPGKEGHIIGAAGKGNTISGNGNANTDAAIYVKGATIQANIIGMDVNGTIAEANAGYGIQAAGGLVIIGGGTQGEGNLISANANHGIFLNNSDNSIIKGNKIGTDINGTNDFGNGGNGIYNTVNSNDVIIGGTATGEGNIISGNTLSGISNDGGNSITIQGNKIGTDITGTQNIGNTGNGILLSSTATMGTIESNIISGNADGIYITGADNGIIKNNKIGTDITGTQNIGNTGYGIFIINNADSHQIGGTAANEGNTIAYNGNSGVGIDGGGGILTDKNKIQRNSIFCNASAGNTLGISLINNGNSGIAAPVITTTNSTTISGTATANATIEIYKDNDNCNGCQGKEYVGTTTADGSGNWSFTGNFCGETLTVTATVTTKGTSQFANCVSLLQVIADAGADQTIALGNSIVIGGSPTASGGTAPYTYSWSPATGLNSATVANPSANPTINTVYTVTVTDAKGCSVTDAMVVTVGLIADAGIDKTIVNGVSVVIGGNPPAAGGLPPYTYSWSPSTGLNSTTIANPTASERSIITYTLTVTDANNNTAIDFVVVDTLYNFCSFDDVFTRLKQEPGYIAANDAQEEAVLDYIAQRAQATKYTIPVVVHILHNGEPLGTGGNISYEQIQSQINALNAAFQRDYALYNQQGHGPRAANTDISFCLATIPAGPASFFMNPITGEECGVMRYDASASPNALDPASNGSNDAALLAFTHPNATFFPFDQYLNIWVVRHINGSITPGVVGYAYPPPPGTPTMDGVVMRSDCFGDNTIQGNSFPLLAMFDQGKIFAHEVGHYLGLLHTHEGPICVSGNDAICNVTGDRVCDTPPCFARNWICPGTIATPNTCNETTTVLGGIDGPDQVENYLSVSDDGCMNTFTAGQAVRMDGFLNVNVFRQMWMDPNLAATGVVKTVDEICPCCELSANILFTPETPCPGELINFITPTGSGYCATTWAWTFTGGTPTNSNVHNPTGIQFNTPGTYVVTLSASDGPRTVTNTVSVTVTVPTAQITGQSVNTNVCNGSLQDIIVAFTGTPPYTITVTGNGGAVHNFNNIIANPATITVPVTPANTSFTISAMSNASCNGTFSGTADFTVIECCTELVVNGGFENNNCSTSATPLVPATTQQSLNCTVYQTGNYAIKNFTTTPTSHGNWPQLSFLPNRGNSMFIDGRPSPVTTSPNQAEIWCENMVIRPFTNYVLTFYTSGGSNGLTFQVKLNGTLVGNTIPINVINYNNWGQYSVVWNSGNIVAGAYPVCLSQVINFDGDGFDYLIDDISIRPVVEIDAGTDATICVGASVQLNATAGKTVYSWTPTTGLNNPNIADPIATPAVTTNYTVTSTDAYGCTASDDVEIEVNPLPAINIFTITSAGCSELKGTFTADEDDIVGGNGPYTILWDNGANTLTVTGLDAGNHTLTITDANGCVSVQNINIPLQNPCPSVTPPIVEFNDCEIWFDCPFFAGLPAGTLFWIDVWPVASGTIPPPSLQYAESCGTDYSFIVANHDPNAHHYYPIPITDPSDFENVNDIPDDCETGVFMNNFIRFDHFDIIEIDDAMFYLKEATYNMRIHLLDPSTNTWYDVDQCVQITDDPNDCFNYRNFGNAGNKETGGKNGNYSQNSSAIYPNGGNEKYKDESQSLNASSIGKNVLFLLYPNPNNGMMQLDYTLNESETGELLITDITGKKISGYNLKEGKHTVDITENELQNGVYLYQVIINGKAVKTDRLVIIK